MMTRAQIRRLIIDTVSVLLISIIVILVGVFLSMNKEELRVQENYQATFNDILPAVKYEELKNEIVSTSEGINHVYTAYDEADEIVGYIADVSVPMAKGDLRSLFAVKPDGTSIIGYRNISDSSSAEEITPEELEFLSSQVLNKPMPIALSASENEDVVVLSDYDPPAGLHDGVFYAQTISLDKKGYIDYVEIEIENGRIKRVQWDGMNIDPTTGSRNNSSLTGAYVISGKNWATQSYNVCHALIELQDVSRLAMKSDGTTEIIPDVTCNISCFVSLAQECLDNSKVNFTKTQYFEALGNLIMRDGGYLEEVTDSNGYMVYAFKDLTIFQRPGSDSMIDRLSVYETTLQSYELTEFEEEIGSENLPTPTPTPVDDSRNGAEDGLVEDGSQSIITNSIDGIPLSEVSTYIPGIPNGSKRASYFVTSANVTYKFFKNYLNWVA